MIATDLPPLPEGLFYRLSTVKSNRDTVDTGRIEILDRKSGLGRLYQPGPVDVSSIEAFDIDVVEMASTPGTDTSVAVSVRDLFYRSRSTPRIVIPLKR
jgi:hypothetical protein